MNGIFRCKIYKRSIMNVAHGFSILQSIILSDKLRNTVCYVDIKALKGCNISNISYYSSYYIKNI